MSDDIVERLRSPEVFIDHGGMFSPVAHVAADEITRLRSDLTAALAECERLNKSRNRWGKKYNDCLGKLRLAVMSDSDYVKEIDYQNTRLRAENERLREALKPFGEALKDNYSMQVDELPIIAGSNQMDIRFKWTLGDLRRARAALEGVMEKEGEGNE